MFPRLCAAKAQKGRGALTSPPDNAWNLLPCVGADASVRPLALHWQKPVSLQTSAQAGVAIRTSHAWHHFAMHP